MIYVGSVLGGPELFYSPFTRAMAGIVFPVPGEPWPEPGKAPDPREFSERVDPRPVGSLDIVFHVPGSLLKPEYTGLRTGRFSRKQRLLQVQVAVPEGADDGTLRAFILQSIRQAILLAKPRFDKARIAYPEAEYLSQVDELEARLAVRGTPLPERAR